MPSSRGVGVAPDRTAMRVQVLGAGDRAGWPVDDCQCASCRRAVTEPRRPTALMIDGVLGLGHGFDAPDEPGRSTTVAGWRIQRLAGTPADATTPPPLVLDVCGPAGQRLLLADRTGPLPSSTIAELTDATFDAVFLGEAGGFWGGAGERPATDAAGRLDLVSFPAELVRLRCCRAIVGSTVVVAVGLGHGNPPPEELGPLLAAWDVALGTDGTVVLAPGPIRPVLGRRTLVLGGSRSGKSHWAERQVLADEAVTYVATAEPSPDPDWTARLARHRARRPSRWETAETLDLTAVLASVSQDGRPGTAGPALLIDDLGNWVARTLDRTGGWDGDRHGFAAAATDLVAAWTGFRGRVVLVSNEVGSGVHPATRAGRVFSDELGRLNTALAAESDEVVMVTAGLTRWLRRPPGMIDNAVTGVPRDDLENT